MKRRIFLSTAGTIGIAGAASSASIVSTAYTSLSTSVSLKEFSPTAKTALDNFNAGLAQNIQELGLKKELASNIAMPVRIIKKQLNGSKDSIIYKNKAGNYVSLSVKDGVETIRISNSL